MCLDNVLARFNTIFTPEQISRIKALTNKATDILSLLVVDVHGLTSHEAKRFINNIINITKGDFSIEIIHGYRHGTKIKDMLATAFSNPHIKSITPDLNNPGVTYLCVA